MHPFIPSERFARWLLGIVDHITAGVGIHHADVRTVVYIGLVLALALGAGKLFQTLVVYIVTRVLDVKLPEVSRELQQHDVLRRTGRLIPPLIFLTLVPFAFDSAHKLTHIIILITLIYTLLVSVLAINSFLDFVWTHYNVHHNDDKRPLRGVLDITKGAVWTVAVVVVVCLIIDRSPLALLTGLGAFATVLLLIFKNSILGLVSGIEMSDNDMLRVGDWIEMPGGAVNGIVIDVSLVVVKVRNYDNTVAMVPTSTLISTTFINWRYMKQSGARRIFMSLFIDTNTVRPLSDDELQKIQTTLPLLKDFIDLKLRQRAAGATANVFNPETDVIGTIDTNLGLYRAYAGIFLKQHPYIYTGSMHMVRLLQPTPQGFPLQIFAYVSTTVWPEYEGVQADIFEHLAAVAPTFGLTIFEEPSSRSVYNIGLQQKYDVPYNGDDKLYTATPKPTTNTTLNIK